MRRRMRGYFAPERIISAVQAAVEMTFEEGMKRERESVYRVYAFP